MFDIAGRIKEEKTNVPAKGTIQLGANYFPGTYIAQIVQGKEKVTLKLVKIAN